MSSTIVCFSSAPLTIHLQPISKVALDEYFIDDQSTEQFVLEGHSKTDDMYFLQVEQTS
jgi:hypothetical protein